MLSTAALLIAVGRTFLWKFVRVLYFFNGELVASQEQPGGFGRLTGSCKEGTVSNNRITKRGIIHHAISTYWSIVLWFSYLKLESACPLKFVVSFSTLKRSSISHQYPVRGLPKLSKVLTALTVILGVYAWELVLLLHIKTCTTGAHIRWSVLSPPVFFLPVFSLRIFSSQIFSLPHLGLPFVLGCGVCAIKVAEF